MWRNEDKEKSGDRTVLRTVFYALIYWVICIIERFSTTSERCVKSAHDTEQISTFFALAQQELSKMLTNNGKDRWIAVLDSDGDLDFEDLLLLPEMEKQCKLHWKNNNGKTECSYPPSNLKNITFCIRRFHAKCSKLIM